jgi:hypothetical protein
LLALPGQPGLLVCALKSLIPSRLLLGFVLDAGGAHVALRHHRRIDRIWLQVLSRLGVAADREFSHAFRGPARRGGGETDRSCIATKALS